MSELDARLAELAVQFDDLQAKLALPETSIDPEAIRRLGREFARMEPVVASYRRLLDTRAELLGAREMREGETDEDLRQMARDEVDRLEADETRQVEELKVLLLPRDPADDGNVILEIRAGAGGEEAALFASELLRMYLRYAERHRWTPEVMSVHQTGSTHSGTIRMALETTEAKPAKTRMWPTLRTMRGVAQELTSSPAEYPAMTMPVVEALNPSALDRTPMSDECSPWPTESSDTANNSTQTCRAPDSIAVPYAVRRVGSRKLEAELWA